MRRDTQVVEGSLGLILRGWRDIIAKFNIRGNFMYSSKNNATNNYLKLDDSLFCRFCGKKCKNLNSLKQHEIRCKNNPDKIKSGSPKGVCNVPLDKRGWSKGLTKYTDIRIEKLSNSLLCANYTSSGRAGTDEAENLRKIKISESMKNNPNAGGLRHGSGRGKKGWYKGYFCDSTYELVYVIYNIDHNIEFERCTNLSYTYLYNNELHKYYPDFILPDGSLIEIKGYNSPQVEAKINSVSDRKINVLYGHDLKYAFDYVKENYTYTNLEDLYE